MADSKKEMAKGRREGKKKGAPPQGQALGILVNGQGAGKSSSGDRSAAKTKGSRSVKAAKEAGENADRLDREQEKALRQTIGDFLQSRDPELQLHGLTKAQRSHVHKLAQSRGIKTVSKGPEDNRILFMSRPQTGGLQHLCLDNAKLHMSAQLSKALKELTVHVERLPNTSTSASLRQQDRRPSNFGLVGHRLIPPVALNRSMQQERQRLPIFQHREKILNVLQSEQVLIVKGATGSGKSTQLPQYILEWAAEHRSPVRIIVSQPRRIAATSVSERISKERGEALGSTVGYQIRMNSKCSSHTVLSLTTSGCLLRALAMDGEAFFRSTTHLIIDEVHERDLDTDFLLLVSKLELDKNRHLRLVLMSATMDLQALSKYFGGATVMDVEGRSFEVRIFHLEDILSKTGYMTYRMENFLGEPTGEEDAGELLAAYYGGRTIIDPDIDNDLIVSLLELLLRSGDSGAVIVYLPGYSDMTMLMDRLESALPRNQIQILLLHSHVDASEQRRVFRVYPGLRLKIILSTNLGQTSITIPDLLYVIDTGRCKMKTYDPGTDASQLTSVWISQADAQQRAGRAGRLRHGICYRLYDSDRFARMSLYTVPEIMRRSLDEICLLTKVAAPDRLIASFLAKALDPPQPEAVLQACSRLQLLGVIKELEERITPLGRIIAELPLGVQMAKCLVYSIYLRCASSMTIIAAFHSVKDPFVLTTDRGKKSGQQNARLLFAGDQMSDSLAALKLYKEFTSLSRYDIGDFCERNSVCRHSMEMFVSAVSTLRESVTRIFGANPAKVRLASSFAKDTNLIRLALTAGYYPKLAYMDRENKHQLMAEGDPFCQVSRNSCLLGRKKQKNLASDWILFVEKTRTAEQRSSLEQTTLVSGLMVALAGGKHFRLEPLGSEVQLCLDSWIRIGCARDVARKIFQLRMLMDREVTELVQTRNLSKADEWLGPEAIRRLLQADVPSMCLAEGKSLPDEFNCDKDY
ncbi:DExH-box ATP-dependent RNA helicase DExH6 [Drosophila elegans]|uniref:DExH-box ATP-dependent RNA helicase DExH6 n=1 Tax=Drosophila elegans TaxID=30023 RepID=UPI0007E81C5B|nr:DExH-box ATP-dependent RNA helicase DExH6 [Drosophila elegans]